MGAMDPVRNHMQQAERQERRERLRRQDRSEQVRATARSRRGI